MSVDLLPRTFSPAEIGKILGIGKSKVLDFIETGELAAIDVSTRRGASYVDEVTGEMVKTRRQFRIAEEALAEFMRARSTVAAPKPAKKLRRQRRTSRTNGQAKQFF